MCSKKAFTTWLVAFALTTCGSNPPPEGGNDTGTSDWYDFDLTPPGADTAETEDLVNADMAETEDPVEFEQGVYIISANLGEPIPTPLTFVSDIVVSPDGRVAIVGADGDAIEGAPRDTQDPDQLFIDSTEEGFAIFQTGTMTVFEGEMFIETDPFNITMSVGPITMDIQNMVMMGIVAPDPDNTSHDRIEGTLTYESAELSTGGSQTSTYEGSALAFSAPFVPPEHVPAGTPSVCGGDLCGAVTGHCDVPAVFPPEGICEAAGQGGE